MARVEMYASWLCPYCWVARFMLGRKGVAFKKKGILFLLGIKLPTRNYRDMVQRTGGKRTIPQIFVDGQYLGDEDTLAELERQGRFEEALGVGRS